MLPPAMPADPPRQGDDSAASQVSGVGAPGSEDNCSYREEGNG